MSEEDLRSMMETMETDFKFIEQRIRDIKIQLERMRKTIEKIERRESTKDSPINVVFDLGPPNSPNSRKR